MTVTPPVTPMLARLARKLPLDGYLYEPKWDGFRCLAFRDGDELDLRSRNQRPLARYFPEIVEALLGLAEPRFVLDGELVVEDGFEALLARLHPAASRVERLRAETPASFVAFDLLGLGDDDLRERSFAARRGRRAMVKVKRERTADCVVAGFRWLVDRPLPSSLLLGLYDDEERLRHVGLASAFSERLRHELLERLRPLRAPLAGHPWEHGFLLAGSPAGRLHGAAGRWAPEEMELDWTPVAPELVCEVAYGEVDGHRFRHPARFRRWRPDRDPASCRLEQLGRLRRRAGTRGFVEGA